MAPKMMKSSGELRAAAKERMKLKDDYDLEVIWKQGFPSNTPQDQAIQDAEKAARKVGNLSGQVVRTELIQTPEHEANGEFLVSLTFGKVKADKAKPDGSANS